MKPWERFSSGTPAAKPPWEQFASSTPAPAPAPQPEPTQPPPEPSFAQKAMIGTGAGFMDIAEGVKQAGLQLGEHLGIVSPGSAEKYTQQVQALRNFYATTPVAQSWTGKGFHAVGSALPWLAAPEAGAANLATRAAMAGASGAAMGAAQFVAPGESRLKNTEIGAAIGTLGTAAIGKIGKYFQGKMDLSQQAMEASQKANAYSDHLLSRAKEMGYVLPPQQAKPGMLNNILSSFSQEGPLNKLLSVKNQNVTNRAVRESLGISKSAPLTDATLHAIRTQAGEAYQAIKSVQAPIVTDAAFMKRIAGLRGDIQQAVKEFPELVKTPQVEALMGGLAKKEFSPTAALEVVKVLRNDAVSNLRNSIDPEKLALGLAQRKAAKAVDDLVARNLRRMGKTHLANAYKQSRQIIARTYDVQSALDETTGNVSAPYLARLMGKGSPLTGQLRTVAEMGKRFRQSMNLPPGGGMPAELSGIDMMFGLLGVLGTGHGYAASLVFARPGLRHLLASGAYQKLLVNPKSYSLPVYRKMMLKLWNNPDLQAILPKLVALHEMHQTPPPDIQALVNKHAP